MEFKGRIYKVLPEQSGTNREGKEWRRLDFIFEYFERADDRYTDKGSIRVDTTTTSAAIRLRRISLNPNTRRTRTIRRKQAV